MGENYYSLDSPKKSSENVKLYQYKQFLKNLLKLNEEDKKRVWQELSKEIKKNLKD